MAEPRVLKLQSPAYGEPIYYKWPLVITKKLDEGIEIAETIRHVCVDFPELKYAVENSILKNIDSRDYECMNQLCQRYNKAIRNILSLWKGRAPPPRMFKPPNKELLRHIINLCYNHAIKAPEKLNIYEPFSPEVYGETSFDMIAQILEEVKSTKEDTFMDLGSGVGQVVLQAAASNKFKDCFGIEKAETPAEFAKNMEFEFRRWMMWFGKTYTEFSLRKGDFLEEDLREKINDSGFIFVNNFAFGPLLNHSLKERFQNLKEGSKIISSREFCPMNFKFNKRNLSELGAMMRVTEIKPRSEEASVSWTGNSVNYYQHVVDRTRLEKYFSILKKKKDGQELDEDELSMYSESSYSVDTTETNAVPSESLEDNLDDLYLGTTTRHQWQLLTDTIKQSKQDAKDDDNKDDNKTVAKKVKVKKVNLKKPNIPMNAGKLQMKNRILKKYGHHSGTTTVGGVKRFSTAKRLQISSFLSPSSSASSSANESNASDDDYSIDNTSTQSDEAPTTQKREKVAKKIKPIKHLSVKKKKTTSNKKEKAEKKVPTTDADDGKNVGDEIDTFLGGLKQQYMSFINKVNTKQYAERLKVMVECEMAKKKLLETEINETERHVQTLISDGLKNFSSRLVELDVVVKTPVELLSKSTVLAEQRHELESKVVSMEIEINGLEEKYKNLCMKRDEGNRCGGLAPLIDSDLEELVPPSEKVEHNKEKLTNKLCTAILSALNHRRSLIDRQSSLSEQVSILEKITNQKADDKASTNSNTEHTMRDKPNAIKAISKSRPVAFVPPRMLSQDKKNTVSPVTTTTTQFPSVNQSDSYLNSVSQSESQLNSNNQSHESAASAAVAVATPPRRRGRPRKKPSESSSDTRLRSPSVQSDTSSQHSKTDMNEISSNYNTNTSIRDENTIYNQAAARNPSSPRYLQYNVMEERAPIIFPQLTTFEYSGDNSDTSDTKQMKKFLKSSSKLLEAASPNFESNSLITDSYINSLNIHDKQTPASFSNDIENNKNENFINPKQSFMSLLNETNDMKYPYLQPQVPNDEKKTNDERASVINIPNSSRKRPELSPVIDSKFDHEHRLNSITQNVQYVQNTGNTNVPLNKFHPYDSVNTSISHQDQNIRKLPTRDLLNIPNGSRIVTSIPNIHRTTMLNEPSRITITPVEEANKIDLTTEGRNIVNNEGRSMFKHLQFSYCQDNSDSSMEPLTIREEIPKASTIQQPCYQYPCSSDAVGLTDSGHTKKTKEMNYGLAKVQSSKQKSKKSEDNAYKKVYKPRKRTVSKQVTDTTSLDTNRLSCLSSSDSAASDYQSNMAYPSPHPHLSFHQSSTLPPNSHELPPNSHEQVLKKYASMYTNQRSQQNSNALPSQTGQQSQQSSNALTSQTSQRSQHSLNLLPSQASITPSPKPREGTFPSEDVETHFKESLKRLMSVGSDVTSSKGDIITHSLSHPLPTCNRNVITNHTSRFLPSSNQLRQRNISSNQTVTSAFQDNVKLFGSSAINRTNYLTDQIAPVTSLNNQVPPATSLPNTVLQQQISQTSCDNQNNQNITSLDVPQVSKSNAYNHQEFIARLLAQQRVTVPDSKPINREDIPNFPPAVSLLLQQQPKLKPKSTTVKKKEAKPKVKRSPEKMSSQNVTIDSRPVITQSFITTSFPNDPLTHNPLHVFQVAGSSKLHPDVSMPPRIVSVPKSTQMTSPLLHPNQTSAFAPAVSMFHSYAQQATLSNVQYNTANHLNALSTPINSTIKSPNKRGNPTIIEDKTSPPSKKSRSKKTSKKQQAILPAVPNDIKLVPYTVTLANQTPHVGSLIPTQSVLGATVLPHQTPFIGMTHSKGVIRPQFFNLRIPPAPNNVIISTPGTTHPVNVLHHLTPSQNNRARFTSHPKIFLLPAQTGNLTQNSTSQSSFALSSINALADAAVQFTGERIERQSSVSSPTFPPPIEK